MSNDDTTNMLKPMVINQKKLSWLWLGILFLFAMNFHNMSNLFIIGLIIVGLLIAGHYRMKVKLSVELFLLALFSLGYLFLYMYYHPGDGLGPTLLYLIGPVGFYFIGQIVIGREKGMLEKTMLVLAIGSFSYGLLNMIIFIKSGVAFTDGRIVTDIWTGINVASTLQGTYFTLVSSLLFYSLIKVKSKSLLLGCIIILATAFSLYSSFILENRTLFMIVAMSLFFNIILYFRFIRKNKRAIFNVLVLTGIVGIMICFLFFTDMFGIKSFIAHSGLYTRMKQTPFSSDPRLQAYTKALQQMLDYPFGGYQMYLGLKYAHNLWLDVLYATGLIPFFFLVLFTFSSLKTLWAILRESCIEPSFKIFVFSLFFGFLLNFMVEPILEGVPTMFMSYCLLVGMTQKCSDILD